MEARGDTLSSKQVNVELDDHPPTLDKEGLSPSPIQKRTQTPILPIDPLPSFSPSITQREASSFPLSPLENTRINQQSNEQNSDLLEITIHQQNESSPQSDNHIQNQANRNNYIDGDDNNRANGSGDNTNTNDVPETVNYSQNFKHESNGESGLKDSGAHEVIATQNYSQENSSERNNMALEQRISPEISIIDNTPTSAAAGENGTTANDYIAVGSQSGSSSGGGGGGSISGNTNFTEDDELSNENLMEPEKMRNRFKKLCCTKFNFLGISLGFGLFLFVICIGTIASSVTFMSTAENDYFTERRSTELLIGNFLAKMDVILESALREMKGIQALISLYGFNVTYSQYHLYVSLSQADIRGIQAFQVCPLITYEEKETFLEHVRSQGPEFRDVYLKDNPHGEVIPSEKRDTYFPIQYTIPLASNLPAVGLDVASQGPRNQSIFKAIETREFVLTERFRLIQEQQANHFGFLIIGPIFDEAKSDRYPAWNGTLIGIVGCVFRVVDLIDAAIEQTSPLFDVRVYDMDATIDARYVFSSLRAEKETGSIELIEENIKNSHFVYRTDVLLMDRVWQFIFTPTDLFLEEYAANTRVYMPIVTFIIAILLSTILAFLLQTILHFAKYMLNVNRGIRLLNKMLPHRIVKRIAKGEKTIADIQKNVSILFMDIVGFTRMSSRVPAIDIVRLLNQMFSKLDELCEKYKLEKIKTVGDCYFVTTPPSKDNVRDAVRIAQFAFSAMEVVKSMARPDSTIILANNETDDDNLYTKDGGIQLNARIGIHVGDVVAGVIGKTKPYFDMWGDSVNMASRMESTCIPGQIQISEYFYNVIKNYADCKERGNIQVKGVGTMKTYFLVSMKDGKSMTN